MIIDTFNEFFFLVDFFTMILPALTAIGIVFLLKDCRVNEHLSGHRFEELNASILNRTDFLFIIYDRITIWISKVIRMKRSSNDDEDHSLPLSN
ncbi:Membrane protein insertion and folding monitor [Bacillus pumilus]|nr:Membrane protein insertion and folding monitor [Bacillus pumilus]